MTLTLNTDQCSYYIDLLFPVILCFGGKLSKRNKEVSVFGDD